MKVSKAFETVFCKSTANSKHAIKNSFQVKHWPLLMSVLGMLMVGTAASAHVSHGVESGADIPAKAIDATQGIEDGVYFYGSAPEPDEIGAAYLVFESQENSIVGAIYMPQSSFDCFQAEMGRNALALQITNSYTQEVYDYAIALVSTDTPIASTDLATEVVDGSLQLEGFFDLGIARDSETTLLETCQTTILAPEMEL